MFNSLNFSYLQMPKEEREDEADSKAHEPGDENEWRTLDILEVFENRDPFWYLPGSLGEHFGLRNGEEDEMRL